MFALRATYLTGRVYSSVFDDGDFKREPEWPPHPSRLFSALVSAWGDGGAEDDLRSALEWIERQPPPEVLAPECDARKTVQAFVPVNDVSKLPEDRPRKGRVFPSATLREPDVYFIWQEAPPPDIASALDKILLRTSSLGHSASLVSVEIAEVPGDTKAIRWQPNERGGLRMRIPHEGRLRELTDRYRRFEENASKIHRPSAGKTALYQRPEGIKPAAACGIFDEMIVLRRDIGPHVSLRSTLSVMAALRGAILTYAPQPVPEYVSGHAPGSTADQPIRSERPHVALAPLASIGQENATGDLLGVAALLPNTLSRSERETCWNIIASISELRMSWGSWAVSVADAEERRKTLRPETWSKEFKVWSTVTPFVFDRFPKDPYGLEAEEIVRNAFVRVGLPEPVELDLHYNPWHLGVPKSAAFPAAPARPHKPQRYHCHVWARFAQSIRGPVLVGAGRYYGYGLFQPLWSA